MRLPPVGTAIIDLKCNHCGGDQKDCTCEFEFDEDKKNNVKKLKGLKKTEG